MLARGTGILAKAIADHTAVAAMTDPREAAEFVERTGVDALAVAVGNVHGLTTTPVPLDLDRLAAIKAAVPVPLVLHGASGLPDSSSVKPSAAASPRSTSTPSYARPTSPPCSQPSLPCCPSTKASLCGEPAERR
jgi:Fructose-bisphosphate aldolase class-II